MVNRDNVLAEEYLAECCERLATIETDLLAIEKGGAEIDEGLVSRVFRAVHSVRGAGLFNLVTIHELAEQIEDVLGLIRSREMVPTPHRVRVLLRATEKLNDLLQNPGQSNQDFVVEIMAALARLCADHRSCRPEKSCASAVAQAHQGGRRLRVLLVEDDFASRLLLQTFLSRYGECQIAVNGREAVEAFHSALEQEQRYDLICMDIMMPELNGREALRQIRDLEAAHGIPSASGTKIIMTTAVDDSKEVILCLKDLCDAYLLKPVDLDKLLSHMQSYRLVQ